MLGFPRRPVPASGPATTRATSDTSSPTPVLAVIDAGTPLTSTKDWRHAFFAAEDVWKRSGQRMRSCSGSVALAQVAGTIAFATTAKPCLSNRTRSMSCLPLLYRYTGKKTPEEPGHKLSAAVLCGPVFNSHTHTRDTRTHTECCEWAVNSRTLDARHTHGVSWCLLHGLLGVAHRCSRELRQDDNSDG